ncbi:MAG: DUF1194 domain-containing protein [Pseudomonadota bacterium]
MRLLCSLTLLFLPRWAGACGLALVLAVDVSGSVDPAEYEVQMRGLSAALKDGIVTDALVDQQAQLTLIQWSGSSRQVQSLPWMQMRAAQDVARFADAVASSPRVWRNYSTAIGEALSLSISAFSAVSQCARKVIDVSGDGVSNEGIAPRSLHPLLKAQNITVNALAIETDKTDLTGYFFENVIVGERAFVVTANGFEDYPEQIRRKLQRETLKQLSFLDE